VQPEVLREEHTGDVVERLRVHGIAGIALAAHDVPHLVRRRLARERDDLGTRAHDVARLLLVEVEDAGEHRRIGLVELAALGRLGHQEAQLVRRVHVLELRHRLDLHHAQQDVRRSVQDPDRRIADAREQHERTRDELADRFRLRERNALRRELPEHDVQEGDDEERRGDGGGRVHRGGGRGDSDRLEALVDQRRERRLTDPAEGQRREGDPELGA
jgi:hypothetical protein